MNVMSLNGLTNQFERYVVPLVFGLLLFSIPISPTFKSIALVVSVGLILMMPAYRDQCFHFLKKPWSIVGIAMFGLVLLGCLWSSAALMEKALVIEKYSKVLYMPFLAAAFVNERVRRWGLYGFLMAMLLTCLLSLFKQWEWIHFNGTDPGKVFLNHIMTGLMISFAAYLSMLFFFDKKGMGRIPYALMALLFSYQVLFVSTGRTGYVSYLILMFLLMTRLSWKHVTILGMLVCSLFFTAFMSESPLRTGIMNVISDIQRYQQVDKDTSIGYRFQFYHFSYTLLKQHPLLGVGTAGFTAAFREQKPVASWDRRLLDPHSQYWLIATEFGVLGLLLYFTWLATLFIASWHLPTMRPIALGLLATISVGNLTDSLLFYSGTGYFFMVLMALCLAEDPQ